MDMPMLANVPMPEISLTIVDVVHVRKWVIRVIKDEWTTETITILRRVMSVIPISSRLADGGKVVKE